MKSLIACQNEASRGLSSASRTTALLSCSNEARSAVELDAAGARNSLIRSSAVVSLVASSSEDRARSRNASMHISRLLLMTRLKWRLHACIIHTLKIFSQNLRTPFCPAFVRQVLAPGGQAHCPVIHEPALLSVGRGPPPPIHLRSPPPRQQREFYCATRYPMLGRPARKSSHAATCLRAHGVFAFRISARFVTVVIGPTCT